MTARATWTCVAVLAGCVAAAIVNALNDAGRLPSLAPPSQPGRLASPGGLAPASGLPAPYRSSAPEKLPPPGGATTLARQSSRTFVYPAANMDKDVELDFWTGFALFRDPWVIAPSSTTARDGLGPFFNARACGTCHRGGGRGEMEYGSSPPISVVVRLGVGANGQSPAPHPDFGPQLQTNGIPGAAGPKPLALDASAADAAGPGALRPEALEPMASRGDAAGPSAFGTGEATLSVRWRTLRGTFADGTPYELLAPAYEVDQPATRALLGNVQLSTRVAPPLLGLGLLEAIPAEVILERADPDDRDGDGISGRANRVPHPVTGETVLGRFGWKADQPTLETQVALAFREDIGITNGIHPDESCTESQLACRGLRTGADAPHNVEIGDDLFDYVVDFAANIALPPAGEWTSAVRLGSEIFREAGCDSCHRPGYTTGESAHGEHLARQAIRPYTDLLLHDMGEGLADRTGDGGPGDPEWRTPPLWGLGLARHITGSESYLHDGRARTIAEAILWHGGEAAEAREEFRSMDKERRAALEAFVRAL